MFEIPRNVLCTFFAVFCLGIESVHLTHAQVNMRDVRFEVYPQVDSSLFITRDDTLFKVDFDKVKVIPFAEMPPRSIFGGHRYPTPSSTVVSDSMLWMWDRSVGATGVFRPDASFEFFPLPSSGSRFSHGSTTRPDTGEPLVFGGYGNFRAKDFFIYFDVRHREWRELPHQKGKDDPKPQTQPHILDIGNGRDVYLIQGYNSDDKSPSKYDKAASSIALAFDISEKVWKKTPMNREVACLVSTKAKNRKPDFRGGGLVYGGLLFPHSNPCHGSYQLFENISEPIIVFWRPDTAEWAYYSADITLPSNHYPIGFLFDDDEVTVFLLSEIMINESNLVTRKISIPDSISWSALPREKMSVSWLIIALSLFATIAAVASISWVVFFRVTIKISLKNCSLIIQRGFKSKEINISYNSLTLLVFMIQEKPPKWNNRDFLQGAFDGTQYDGDTMRTIINRAINSLNDLSQRELHVDFIERRSSEYDRRFSEYRINPYLSMKSLK